MDGSQKDDKFKVKSSFFQPKASSGLGEKEKEISGREREILEVVGKEIEPTKEIKETGVRLKKEEVEVPPPIEKLGVRPVGPAVPPPPPAVSLPLTDDQVLTGLAAPILSSLRWLAEFCLRQLKKALISLRKIHGRIVRVKT